jgi:hypothetical protein
MRPKYQERKILLVGSMQVESCKQLLDNAPIDPLKPIECVLREKPVVRKLTQNSLYWAGALTDISQQAWVNGKLFSIEVWHENFKREYLPEEHQQGITKEGYRKWDFLPNGERVLVGSTGDLLTGGFSDYLEQVYSYGASLGVLFRTVRDEPTAKT